MLFLAFDQVNLWLQVALLQVLLHVHDFWRRLCYLFRTVQVEHHWLAHRVLFFRFHTAVGALVPVVERGHVRLHTG